ncbi:MAG: hypothetical protein ACXWT7_08015 [Methylophilaceae bacterium]
MKYILRKAVLDPVPELEITPKAYADLKSARNVLTNAFAIEEKYEIVISNFLDLEKQLLVIAVTNSVRSTLNYAEFFDTQSVLNIRLVNLLTGTRLYLDQLQQHVESCAPKQPNIKDLVKTRCSKEYDDFFEYRFMEALRNHVQHRGIPIHFIDQKSQWTSFKDDGLMEFSVHIFAQRKYLEEDEKFKKAILNEISKNIDLIATSRKYIESISAINEFVRESIKESVLLARETIESAHNSYKQVYTESLVGICAMEINNGQEISSVPLLLDWDDVRIQLQKRNKQLINLTKRFVSSKTL